MYANVTIKSKLQTYKQHKFETTINADMNVRSVINFSRQLERMNTSLNLFHMYMEVESISKGSNPLDGSDAAKLSRINDKARFAEIILASGITDEEPL